MKIGFFFILILKFQFLLAQRSNDTIVGPSIGLHIDRVKQRQERLNAFADSINYYSSGALPRFLFNECFDFESDLWESLHSPVSLRWKILQNVNSRKALQMILNAGDKRLKKKCSYKKGSNPELIVPMIRKSFFQLVRKRYKQLK